jgi:hypothetical protein
MDTFSYRLLHTERTAAARHLGLALENVYGADVERSLRAFGVEEPGVSRRKRLAVGLKLGFDSHSSILKARL